MRKNETQDLKAIIKDLFKNTDIERRIQDQDIIDSWESIVGPMFAKYTSKVVLRYNKLYVTMNSAVVKQELSMAKSSLLKAFNEKFPDNKLSDIVFY